MSELPNWDLPEPFVIEVVAGPETIDSYGHVNNRVYLGWLEACAWAHSAALGFDEAKCIEMERGMAVRNLNLDYLAACYQGDEIAVANWVIANDGKLRATRRFQLINRTRAQVAMRGEILYVCMNLSTGRPVRMPEAFVRAYQPDTRVPEDS
ncbi:MAG: acyl-CoA thioesterase [Gammaproteobacteria bacterium]|jgi:acyl-CoA thioester hydrolase|nr:MAG: acyl-CoA thioesterase [Gammaproteobacteria bacterium]